ncbi:hypothetical protein [Agrobacterium tumefaciens]|uniref:hypothetical protein n=1 Tax=Agrobacterium tumefaciens TaxID=358 RepID=UPI001571641E|nr:hypothetical protein [Agrobacterium tumefaciens]
MWNSFLAKWKTWGEAFAGIDDLQGDQLIRLEERVRRLEQEMANVAGPGGPGSEIERELSLDRLNTRS